MKSDEPTADLPKLPAPEAVMNTYDRRTLTVFSTRTPLDREILAAIPTSGPAEVQAFLVWVDRDGEVQFGPCRYREVWDNATSYSVSPFPGAWVSVDDVQVIAVRHPQALLSRRDAQRIADLPRWGDAQAS